MKNEDNRSAILESALAMALKFHAGQTRSKGDSVGLPYVVHPIEVMKTVCDWGIRDLNVLVAAVLHDSLEDTQLDPRKIEEQFGSTVRVMVEELTFLPIVDEDAARRSQRKAEYLAEFHMRSPGALVIKVADRFCNTWDFVRDEPTYAAAYYKKASHLLDAFGARAVELAERFGKTVPLRVAEAKKRLEMALIALRV